MGHPTAIRDRRSISGGAVSGVGGGTLLGMLIGLIPDTSPTPHFIKQVLTLLAPSLSLLICGLYIYLDGRLKQMQADSALRDWEIALMSTINDPLTPEESKEQLRADLVELRTIKLNIKEERFRVLAVRLPERQGAPLPEHA